MQTQQDSVGVGDQLAQDLASFSNSLTATPLGTWGLASGQAGCGWSGVECSNGSADQGWTLSLQGQNLKGACVTVAVVAASKPFSKVVCAGVVSAYWTQLPSFATLTGAG